MDAQELEFIMKWVISPLVSFLFVSLISLGIYIWKSDKKGSAKRDKILEQINETLSELRLMTAENKTRIDVNEKEINRIRDGN